MTFNEAMAAHAPAWVVIWTNILLLGAVVLPLTLAFWKSTRLTALLSVFASAISIGGIMFLYQQLGYVKLLGLAHIIAWTPLAIHLALKMRAPSVPRPPRIIMGVIFATIMVSLVFDYVDTIRYFAGDRTPLAVAPL
ncbi:hypothetical protein [uncultured Tateyamaria sp.]|uniref:hypothetical protein n=1 Tax=uncultured Tateyamaria sp. TaxID=455651 RepID=UPI0026229981|nr:hypothetical protein [uncultured Tateyamaria sp.]